MTPALRAIAIGLALSFAGIPAGGFAGWVVLTLAGSADAGGAFVLGLFVGPFLGGAGAGANAGPGFLTGAATGACFALAMILLAALGQSSDLLQIVTLFLPAATLLGAAGGVLGSLLRSRQARTA